MKRPAVPVPSAKTRKAAVADGGKSEKSEPCHPVNLDLLGDDALLREKQILTSVAPVSRSTFLRWLEDGIFPKPIRVGSCRLWAVGAVRRWLLEQAAKNAVGGAQ